MWAYSFPMQGQVLADVKLAKLRSIFLGQGHNYTIYKGDFRNGTFVPLKWKDFFKPLDIQIKQTNQIASFDQPMKSNQSDCLF